MAKAADPEGRVKDVLKEAFASDVPKYVNGCRDSVARNRHMNEYDGEEFDKDAVLPWLHGVCDSFAESYSGGPRCGDVMFALAEHVRTKRTGHGLPCKQATVDALLVDLVNYLAGVRCGMDMAMYTRDLGPLPAPSMAPPRSDAADPNRADAPA